MYDVNNFGIRTKDGGFSGLNWGRSLRAHRWTAVAAYQVTVTAIRATTCVMTATFGGFSVSASWGEDDLWAVVRPLCRRVARHSSVAAAVAFNQSSDENGPGGLLIIHDTASTLAALPGRCLR